MHFHENPHISQPATVTVSILRPRPCFAFQYLSEDEAGGRGAAIGPLEPAPPGISPPIHLYGKKQDLSRQEHFLSTICL